MVCSEQHQQPMHFLALLHT